MSKPVGLQMYTVRDYAEKDFLGTVKKVAEIGYKGIELTGTYGVKAKELKEVLDSLDIKICGSHTAIDLLEKDFNSTIEFNLTVGNKNIVCPWLPESKRNSADIWKETAEELNSLGERLKIYGLTLSYHNHNFEFEKFGDKYGIDILIENTSSENLKLEVDVFWVKFAGLDPGEFLKMHSDRINLIHLKDMEPDQKTFAEVGEGIIDFKPIFEIGDRGIIEWYVVEQDVCKRSSLESARISFENLKKLGRI
ncbi:MAG: sugar phosphate isomerase/epimerase family protein [bacterium]